MIFTQCVSTKNIISNEIAEKNNSSDNESVDNVTNQDVAVTTSTSNKRSVGIQCNVSSIKKDTPKIVDCSVQTDFQNTRTEKETDQKPTVRKSVLRLGLCKRRKMI